MPQDDYRDSRYDEDEDAVYETVWPEDAGHQSDRQKQFKADMEEAGRRVEFYRGRFFYKGWATRTEDLNELQEVIRDTVVPLQWDQLGKNGNIIYPQSG